MYGDMGGYSDAVGDALGGVGGSYGADLGGSYGGGMGGWGADITGPGPSSQSGVDALDESNNPTNPAGGTQTANFNTATLSGAMRSAASKVGSFLSNITNNFDITSMMPGVGMMQGMGSVLGMMGYNKNPNNFNFANRTAFDNALRNQYTDPNAYDFDNLTTTFTGPEKGRRGLISAAMSGSGAHMGIATGRNPQGLNVGPGFQGSQDVMPGQGVNPYSGVAMADPPDPYIRKQRGTEMAAMVGP